MNTLRVQLEWMSPDGDLVETRTVAASRRGRVVSPPPGDPHDADRVVLSHTGGVPTLVGDGRSLTIDGTVHALGTWMLRATLDPTPVETHWRDHLEESVVIAAALGVAPLAMMLGALLSTDVDLLDLPPEPEAPVVFFIQKTELPALLKVDPEPEPEPEAESAGPPTETSTATAGTDRSGDDNEQLQGPFAGWGTADVAIGEDAAVEMSALQAIVLDSASSLGHSGASMGAGSELHGPDLQQASLASVSGLGSSGLGSGGLGSGGLGSGGLGSGGLGSGGLGSGGLGSGGLGSGGLGSGGLGSGLTIASTATPSGGLPPAEVESRAFVCTPFTAGGRQTPLVVTVRGRRLSVDAASLVSSCERRDPQPPVGGSWGELASNIDHV